jgi:hypothetical protein
MVREFTSLAPSVFFALAFCLPISAQYTAPYIAVIGPMSSSNGMPAANYALTFQPTQVMFVGGTSVVVANSNCATDASGAVVGIRNPLTGPVVNVVYSGTLPAANYYIEITWYDTYTHQTLHSPEIQTQLTSAGQLQISPPTGGAAANTIGMNVYIGTSSGSETYQGQTTTPTATFTQSTPLVTGATPPIVNGTVCQVVANDAAWPIAGYLATLTNASGLPVAGFPQQWQFVGPGSTYNLSNGFPLYNGRVTYPVPLLTTPYNHNAQSISGPLSLSGYNLYNVGEIGVGTSLPAWGVDVEGSGLAGLINSISGYLVNGSGGTTGQCLGSDGTAFDTAVSCTSANQNIEVNGSLMTQRPTFNLIGNFISGADSSSPARTNITFNATGTESYLVTASGPGTNGRCAQWDASGGITQSTGTCLSGTVSQKNCLSVSCAGGSIYSFGTTYTNSSGVAVIEEVSYSTLAADECTGASSYITAYVNGLIAGHGGIFNQCQGVASIPGFVVPAGATFEVVYTAGVNGGNAPSSHVNDGWLENNL